MAVETPAFRSWIASAQPAGPDPTIATSKRTRLFCTSDRKNATCHWSRDEAAPLPSFFMAGLLCISSAYPGAFASRGSRPSHSISERAAAEGQQPQAGSPKPGSSGELVRERVRARRGFFALESPARGHRVRVWRNREEPRPYRRLNVACDSESCSSSVPCWPSKPGSPITAPSRPTTGLRRCLCRPCGLGLERAGCG